MVVSVVNGEPRVAEPFDDAVGDDPLRWKVFVGWDVDPQVEAQPTGLQLDGFGHRTIIAQARMDLER